MNVEIVVNCFLIHQANCTWKLQIFETMSTLEPNFKQIKMAGQLWKDEQREDWGPRLCPAPLLYTTGITKYLSFTQMVWTNTFLTHNRYGQIPLQIPLLYTTGISKYLSKYLSYTQQVWRNAFHDTSPMTIPVVYKYTTGMAKYLRKVAMFYTKDTWQN